MKRAVEAVRPSEIIARNHAVVDPIDRWFSIYTHVNPPSDFCYAAGIQHQSPYVFLIRILLPLPIA